MLQQVITSEIANAVLNGISYAKNENGQLVIGGITIYGISSDYACFRNQLLQSLFFSDWYKFYTEPAFNIIDNYFKRVYHPLVSHFFKTEEILPLQEEWLNS